MPSENLFLTLRELIAPLSRRTWSIADDTSRVTSASAASITISAVPTKAWPSDPNAAAFAIEPPLWRLALSIDDFLWPICC